MARHSWVVEHDVRADADSVFVPAALLPGAAVGDDVELRSHDAGTRCGRVTALMHDGERGNFVRVAVDASTA